MGCETVSMKGFYISSIKQSNINFVKMFKYIYVFLKSICNVLYECVNSEIAFRQLTAKYPNATIYKPLYISEDTIIGKGSIIYHDCSLSHVVIGKYSYIDRNSYLNNTKIGNYCSIANNVHCGMGEHVTDDFSTSPFFNDSFTEIDDTSKFKKFADYKGFIDIGNDVWIGDRVTLLDNIKIGNGAIIAAGAVVVSDVEPYTIVGGVPAKFIKK